MSSTRRTELEQPEALRDGKVVRGRGGWLFLGNDSNRVLTQHSGAEMFTPEKLRQWQFVLENRVGWLEREGVRYLFLVPPNAHSVYPEKLPEDVVSAPLRPIEQLMGHLEAAGSYARLIYPLEELRREKSRPVYPRSGSHWTELGAFIAYRKLMEGLEREVAVRALSWEDVCVTEDMRVGDLGFKVDPQEASLHAFVDVLDARSRVVADNRVPLNGRRVRYESDLEAPTCLVLGDSFSWQIVPLLAESFGSLVFAHLTTLDYLLVREVRPDVVVTVMNERFMIRVPFDVPAPTSRELEAEKRAQGKHLGPRDFTGTRLDSRRPPPQHISS